MQVRVMHLFEFIQSLIHGFILPAHALIPQTHLNECVQVATLCVERGHLMWQLWAALRHMLRLTLQDRDMSRCGQYRATGSPQYADPR